VNSTKALLRLQFVIRGVENDESVVSPHAPILFLDVDAMFLGVRFEVGCSLA
jgi:hypothetical protein